MTKNEKTQAQTTAGTTAETKQPGRPTADEKPDTRPAEAPLVGLAEDRSPEARAKNAEKAAEEIGGPNGPEPTRYGDWEIGGRCTDF